MVGRLSRKCREVRRPVLLVNESTYLVWNGADAVYKEVKAAKRHKEERLRRWRGEEEMEWENEEEREEAQAGNERQPPQAVSNAQQPATNQPQAYQQQWQQQVQA